MYYFAAYLLKVLLSLFGRLNVYEKEKLPNSGGYVIACTHTGWVDVLWLGISILPLKLHYMAKKELFQKLFLKWFLSQLNAFPVDRDNPGPSTLKIPRKLLKKGEIVGIFPSGTRSSEGVPLKRGAAAIAISSNVPLIPAVYIGPSNFRELLKRKKPCLIFGDPIVISEELPKKDRVEGMMTELNRQFKALQSDALQRK
ncbi:lysophospholipid acyltransferase family protein [Metabacillus arenae]|uniref:1-acyl-sn-glycerol-3-phosphate acyltransferase n=1 Tax=Metabacillus arenae TaxID=2771434 RepID=A0A926NM24_9BACI|nr:lysophospholipid acyltransferase family protein [Metabacillus arenae]MBD1380517.1 1-acyl-sn-glycerol-3-phosphate acyltransferase [Metabacillus arenae]